jgi:hypothetical protein
MQGATAKGKGHGQAPPVPVRACGLPPGIQQPPSGKPQSGWPSRQRCGLAAPGRAPDEIAPPSVQPTRKRKEKPNGGSSDGLLNQRK